MKRTTCLLPGLRVRSSRMTLAPPSPPLILQTHGDGTDRGDIWTPLQMVPIRRPCTMLLGMGGFTSGISTICSCFDGCKTWENHTQRKSPFRVSGDLQWSWGSSSMNVGANTWVLFGTKRPYLNTMVIAGNGQKWGTRDGCRLSSSMKRYKICC